MDAGEEAQGNDRQGGVESKPLLHLFFFSAKRRRKRRRKEASIAKKERERETVMKRRGTAAYRMTVVQWGSRELGSCKPEERSSRALDVPSHRSGRQVSDTAPDIPAAHQGSRKEKIVRVHRNRDWARKAPWGARVTFKGITTDDAEVEARLTPKTKIIKRHLSGANEEQYIYIQIFDFMHRPIWCTASLSLSLALFFSVFLAGLDSLVSLVRSTHLGPGASPTPSPPSLRLQLKSPVTLYARADAYRYTIRTDKSKRPTEYLHHTATRIPPHFNFRYIDIEIYIDKHVEI